MIRFQSKVTADLVMFNEHGSVLLEIWGKTPGAKGILLAAEMAEADAAVRDFIGRHGAVDHKAADNNAGADQASKPPPGELVSAVYAAVEDVGALSSRRRTTDVGDALARSASYPSIRRSCVRPL